MARGLMVYPMGGTIDGRRGDHVLLAPPFIVDRADIDTDRRAAGAGDRRSGRERVGRGNRGVSGASAQPRRFG